MSGPESDQTSLRCAAASSDTPLSLEEARLAAPVLLALHHLHVTPSDDSLASLALSERCLAALRACSPAAVAWPSDAAARLAAEGSLPDWLARTLLAELGPQHALQVALSSCSPGPVTLRCNWLRSTPAALQAALAAAGVASQSGLHCAAALRLCAGRPAKGVWRLPGWSEGAFEVQDEGSQLIAAAVQSQPGDTVLDLCAGNGGKTLALAADVGVGGRVFAFDIARTRLAALTASALRAGAGDIVSVLPAADAVDARLDAILIDAPCSGSGVLRRRPSLRWQMTEAEAHRDLPATQRALLSQAAAIARAHGRPHCRIVYATCSVLQAENQAVAAWFDDTFGAHFEACAFEEGQSPSLLSMQPAVHQSLRPHERLLLPHLTGTDGFFIARWRLRL